MNQISNERRVVDDLLTITSGTFGVAAEPQPVAFLPEYNITSGYAKC
jgi:hypothetical protein